MAAVLPALPPGAALAGDPKTLPPVQRPPHGTQLAAPTVCRQTDGQTDKQPRKQPHHSATGWVITGFKQHFMQYFKGVTSGGAQARPQPQVGAAQGGKTLSLRRVPAPHSPLVPLHQQPRHWGRGTLSPNGGVPRPQHPRKRTPRGVNSPHIAKDSSRTATRAPRRQRGDRMGVRIHRGAKPGSGSLVAGPAAMGRDTKGEVGGPRASITPCSLSQGVPQNPSSSEQKGFGGRSQARR